MRLLLLALAAFSCHAQQVLLVSGKATVPLPATAGGGITNTTFGLVNWWKLDENTGTTTADSAGSATGTLMGDVLPTWTNGVIGSAIRGGSLAISNYVQLATNIISGSSGLTMTCWYWTAPGFSDDPFLIYDSDGDISKGLYWFYNAAISKLQLSIVNTGADEARDCIAFPASGTWMHFTVTWDGVVTDFHGIHIYTNAVEGTYSGGNNGSGSHVANTTTQRFIGAHPQVSASAAFIGAIDDFRVYNRVLSAGEITNLFQWRGEL